MKKTEDTEKTKRADEAAQAPYVPASVILFGNEHDSLTENEKAQAGKDEEKSHEDEEKSDDAEETFDDGEDDVFDPWKDDDEDEDEDLPWAYVEDDDEDCDEDDDDDDFFDDDIDDEADEDELLDPMTTLAERPTCIHLTMPGFDANLECAEAVKLLKTFKPGKGDLAFLRELTGHPMPEIRALALKPGIFSAEFLYSMADDKCSRVRKAAYRAMDFARRTRKADFIAEDEKPAKKPKKPAVFETKPRVLAAKLPAATLVYHGKKAVADAVDILAFYATPEERRSYSAKRRAFVRTLIEEGLFNSSEVRAAVADSADMTPAAAADLLEEDDFNPANPVFWRVVPMKDVLRKTRSDPSFLAVALDYCPDTERLYKIALAHADDRDPSMAAKSRSVLRSLRKKRPEQTRYTTTK